MEKLISEIKIGNRFRNDVGNLDELVLSIKEVGLLHPIVIDENNNLIAGLRRIKAFEKLGKTQISVNVVNLDNLKKGEIQENVVRLDFSPTEIYAIDCAMREQLETEAKERQGARTDLDTNIPKNLGNVKKPSKRKKHEKETQTVIGRFVKKSGPTVRKIRKIHQVAEKKPEKYKPILEKLDKREMSVDKAYKFMKGNEEPKPFIPNPFNIWFFNDCDPRFGKEIEGFHGRIPGQIIQNVIYYFVEPKTEALIVDPMSGTGTTFDVVDWWNKTFNTNFKVYTYDSEPQRQEIQKNIFENGLPNEAKDCDLIFIDPPYYDMVFKGLYTDLSDFYKTLNNIALICYQTLNNSGVVAFITCDLTRDEEFECLSHFSAEVFLKNGFKIQHRISVPLSTQSANGNEIVLARKNRKLLGRDRVLYIFKKV